MLGALTPKSGQAALIRSTKSRYAGSCESPAVEPAVTTPTMRSPELLLDDRVGHEDAAHDLVGEVALELGVLVHECDRARPAHAEEEAVDVVGYLGDEGRVVLLAEGRPEPVLWQHLAAERAELGHEARHLRVREVVVVCQGGDVAPAEHVVGVGAEACRPLRSVRVEAEEVGRLDLEGRVLSARGAVDERDLRELLGVVRHGDALAA